VVGVILFEGGNTRAAFWFAAEEYIMRVFRPCEPALMCWRTDDTVMLGANQVARAECDMEYAKAVGVEIVRRPSGGGAIFTDPGTLQVTVIIPLEQNLVLSSEEANASVCDPKEAAREWLAEPITEALAFYGVYAALEGRNDIIVGGRKVSGIAQHARDGYLCSHASLLFNTDLERLAKVLTVDSEKIQTKAVPSVRARVANIADLIAVHDSVIAGHYSDRIVKDDSYHTADTIADIVDTADRADTAEMIYTAEMADTADRAGPASLGDFLSVIIDRYSQKGLQQCRAFSQNSLSQIEQIMHERYANPDWTFGSDPAFTFTNKKRFPGGQVEVFLDVKGGVIRGARIRGDFLALRPASGLEERLLGVPHREEALTEALRGVDATSILGSISAAELLSVLI